MLPEQIAIILQNDAERRYSTRYVFRADIEVRWGTRIVWGHVLNVSRHGMFVELPENPPVNAEFEANLSLNTPLRIKCKVRRTIHNYGVGVTVTIQDEESKRRYNALLFALAEGADLEGAAASVSGSPAPQISKAAAASARR